MQKATRRSLQFVAVFLLLAVVLTWVLQLNWVDRNFVRPYTRFLAGLSASIFDGVGLEVQSRGTILASPSFAVDIRRGCDGLVATILLVSACFAFPFSWRNRLIGIGMGISLIFFLNMFRILSLFVIGQYGTESVFEFFHVYVFQFLVIAAAMVFWVYWASRSTTASS